MSDDIQVAASPRRPIAAVAAAATGQEFPGQRRGMLDEVHACLRQAEIFYRLRPAAGAPS